jgi:asparagine synthetase B (glutamine-hydrolysing)
LVVWDAERQAVVLASDYMGVRPLHYLLRPDSVSWSTTLECLVHMHNLYDEVEPHYIVGFLSNARPAGITLYKGVLAVGTAQSITISRDSSVVKSRFWNLSAPEIRYRTPEDYEEHMRTLFFDAVRHRLRSPAPVWSELSGGLDSSAVVCAADVLIKQGLAVTPELRTFSFISDGSPETDERRFVACVDQHCGRTTHFIQQDSSFEFVDPVRHWITPAHAAYGTLQSYKLVSNSGGRILLTGHGGIPSWATSLITITTSRPCCGAAESSGPCGLRASARGEADGLEQATLRGAEYAPGHGRTPESLEPVQGLGRRPPRDR